MANVRFNIDKKNILLIYHISARDIVKLSIREQIDFDCWDRTKGRVKGRSHNAFRLNRLLTDLILFVDNTRIEFKTRGVRLTGPILKKLLIERIFGVDVVEQISFYDYAKSWIKSRKLAPATIKVQNNAIAVLYKRWPKLTFDTISLAWLSQFNREMDQHSQNYRSMIIRRLKEMMDAAYADGLHTNIIYQNRKFSIKTIATDHIYVPQVWIDKLYDKLGTLEPRHHNAAIIFLIGCMCGQRWQNYSIIKKSFIVITDGVPYISVVQPKTTTRVTIPVSERLISLLDMDPHELSQQKFNQYIKEAFTQIGYPDADRVSSHTARRTFATLSVLAGVDTSLIMKITGHKSEKTFRLYIKMDDVIAAAAAAPSIIAYQDKKA